MDDPIAPSSQLTLKNSIQKFNELAKLLNKFGGVNLRSPEALDELTLALTRVPSGELFADAVDEARVLLEAAISDLSKERVLAFGRIEAGFVGTARDRGTSTREQNDGWRIGMLEFQFRRTQARARVLYNHEELLPFKPISDLSDLEKLERDAIKLLTSSELPIDMLCSAFWGAYEFERDRRSRDRKTRPELVPLPDFYRELRASLVRYELNSQKPDKRLQHAELPRWKFLYNLDRYRAQGPSLPSLARVGFQTGSQQDVLRGLGFSINGLDAAQEYKTVCYVTSV